MKANIKTIIQLRKQRKISVRTFAEQLGISARTVYNWENNISQPKKKDVLAIAQILKVRVSDISDNNSCNFYYSKPTLNKLNELEESFGDLKEIANRLTPNEYSKIMPVLQLENKLERILIENRMLTDKVNNYKILFDQIDVIVYVKNYKRIVTFVNQEFLKILPERCAENDIIGHKFLDIYSIKECESIIILENKAFYGDIVFKHDVIFPVNNSLKRCLISIKPLEINNGKIQSIVVTVKPIITNIESIKLFNK